MRETARVDARLPPGLYALPGEVEEGFTYPDGRVAVFRRDSLLGRRREARRRTGGRALASFADLKVGDLVVHAMQGIGRFEGLVAQEVLGSTRDYMQVSYRGGDTLFVPYEQMELLRTWGATARLDKLGGATWAQVTDRVRKRVKALAGELLRLHAARPRPRLRFPRRWRVGEGARGRLPLPGDPRSGVGHLRRQDGYAEAAPDGPSDLRGRRLRQDGGVRAGRIQGGSRRQADHDARPDDHPRAATRADL